MVVHHHRKNGYAEHEVTGKTFNFFLKMCLSGSSQLQPGTACLAQPTNQHWGKQRVGIFTRTGALCGHKPEVSLTDNFPERRVTDV